MNGIVGSILVILGVLCLAGSMIVLAGVCAKTVAAAALLHVATCDQTNVTVYVLLFVGINFLAVGAVLLLTDTSKQGHVSVPKAVPRK